MLMVNNFIVAVTGVPASGKTTFAKSLKKALGRARIIELNHLVMKHGAFYGKMKLGAHIVKLAKLNSIVRQELNGTAERERNVIIVGHLVPEININADILVVLREKLDKLAARMEIRRYQKKKIAENLSAEVSQEWLYGGKLKYEVKYEAEDEKDRKKLISYIKACAENRKPTVLKEGKIGNRIAELKKLVEDGNKYGL